MDQALIYHWSDRTFWWQAALYDNPEDTSTPHDITAMPTTLSSNSITDQDWKTATEFSKETATQRDLAQL